MRTGLCALLDLELPLIQAPMAGVSTPALASAVSAAGGLGSVAIGASSATDADRLLAASLPPCNGRVNVNVFAHRRPVRDPALERAWLGRMQPLFAELAAEPPTLLREVYPTFDDAPELLDVLMAHRPAVVSFHFGVPEAKSLKALKSYEARLIGTATSVTEARRLAAAGFDVIVAQGYEAGGHRGTFEHDVDERLSTMTLLSRIVAAVDVPVLAAGGISSGAGIAAALVLGAAGVQIGTAFIDCPESSASEAHRRALRTEDRRTVMTSVFSGRPARSLVNRLVRELAELEDRVPAYPVAYDAAKQLAAAAIAQGSSEFSPMWAGQGAVRPEPLPAGELVRRLAEETDEARAI